MYGFSSTSSELINTNSTNSNTNSLSESINNDNLSNASTPYKLSSDTLNTSDINLVSVDQDDIN